MISSENRSFIMNNLFVLGRQVAATVFSVVIAVILTQTLGADGKGVYELVFFLPLMLVRLAFNFGIPISTTYVTASDINREQYIFQVTFSLALLASLLSVLMGGAIIYWGQDVYAADVASVMLYAGLALLPPLIIYAYLRGVFAGVEDFRSLGLIDTVQSLVTSLVLVVLLLTGQMSVWNALLALWLGHLATVVMLVIAQRRRAGTWMFLRPVIDVDLFRRLLGYGLKLYPTVMFYSLLLRMDIFFIGSVGGGAASVGIYSVAVMVAERMWTFSEIVGTVLLPRITRWQGEDAKRNHLTSLIVRYTLWFNLFASLVLVVVGRPLIVLAFSAEFSPAFDSLLALLPGITFMSLMRVAGSDVVGRGLAGRVVKYAGLAAVMNLVCNIWLVPRYDIVGAAIASSIAYAVYGLGVVYVFLKESDLHWTQLVFLNRQDLRYAQQILKMVLPGRKG